jgi:hypothetical protein
MTGKREVIDSSVGLVPTNAAGFSNSPISTAAHLDEHIIANACFHCLCHLETCIGLESSVLGHVL